MAGRKPIIFEKKINELQERKSQLDISFLKGEREKYQKRIVELLEAPVNEGDDNDAVSRFNEIREYHAKVKEINDKIEQLPENAEELVKQIESKISTYQQDRERIKNLELYHDTKEGISEILGGDIVYQYAKRNNDDELKDKLKKRSLTVEEYLHVLEKCLSTQEILDLFQSDFPEYLDSKRSEIERMYEELFPLEGDNKPQNRRKVRVKNPKKTLSNLGIEYQTIDGIILPTKGSKQTIKKGKLDSKDSDESEVKYENKINILFSRVLTPENGFMTEDYNVIAGQKPEKMVRKTTYVIVEIPKKNKMIILNNGYGEASFLCDEMFDMKLLTTISKEELIEKHGKSIKRLEYLEEQRWIDELLKRLFEDLKTNAEVAGETTKSIGENTEATGEVTGNKPEQQNGEENDRGIFSILGKEFSNIDDALRNGQVDRGVSKEFLTIVEPYFQKHDDLKIVLICFLQEGYGRGGILLLRNKNFKSILDRFDEWIIENKDYVNKCIRNTNYVNKKDSDWKKLAEIDLFIRECLKVEVDKLARNYKELKKLFDENSALIKSLKNVELKLGHKRLDDSLENKVVQGDLELDENIKNGLLYVCYGCVKMFENGAMNDDFCKTCRRVIDFLSEYKQWFIVETKKGKNETEDKGIKDKGEIRIPNIETMLNFVVDLYQGGLIDDEEYENIKKQLEHKRDYDIKKVEIKENEELIGKLKQKNEDVDIEFKNLSVVLDIKSNFGKVGYEFRRIIVDMYKKKQKIDNVILEYKNRFIDDKGEITEDFDIDKVESFIVYLYDNSLISESVVNNLIRLLCVNKILGLEIGEEEKGYIIDYMKNGGNFRVKFSDGLKPEVREIANLWEKYPDFKTSLQGLGFIFTPKKSWISTKERPAKTAQKNDKNIGAGVDGQSSEGMGKILEDEKKIIRRISESENKVEEFKKMLGELVGSENVENNGENRRSKLEEIERLDGMFPGALNDYIEDCIKRGRFSFNSHFAFKKRKGGGRNFDFSVAQAGILDKAIDVCGTTDENFKNIFEYLGFFVRKQFNFEDYLGVDAFSAWIKNAMRTVIKQSYQCKMGCFSGEYRNNDDKWHKIDLQKLSIINIKKTKNKFAIGKKKQGYRIGLVGRDGYYVLFKIFPQHDGYSSSNNTGWLYEKRLKDEKNAFREKTGMELE